MIDFEVKGAIFDMDDTLLDNQEGLRGEGLHERSRLSTVHEIGISHGIRSLVDYPAEANISAFRNASVHTTKGAMWQILYECGVVNTKVIDLEHPLLNEMEALGFELHTDILSDEAEEITDASAFIRGLGRTGLKDKMAIASSGILKHIQIFINKVGLTEYFPLERIKSLESFTDPKPHPAVYNLAFESLGLTEADRSHTVAFEDDPRGIEAARAAGLYVCAIATRYTKEDLMSLKIPPDFAANSYKEFSGYFNISI